jgi:hypothetical protein
VQARLAEALGRLQALVEEGRVVAATYPEVVAAWKTKFQEEPNAFATSGP